MDQIKLRCQCCRLLTLLSKEGYEICDVCDWQNDPAYDNGWPVEETAGPNGISLVKARMNYAMFGSADATMNDPE